MTTVTQSSAGERLHALDAVRGFALLLGVAFHAALSFIPGLPPGFWAMSDHSTSPFLGDAAFVSHIFRMSLFFFIAGFFGRLLFHKLGARGFAANRGKRIAVPMIAGWLILAPAILVVWSWGASKVFAGNPPAPPAMPANFFPLFHLWFLYQLLILYVAVIGLRAIVVRFDANQKLRGLVDAAVIAALRLPIAVFALGIPLAAALVSLPFWFYGQGIPTPDLSLIPQVAACVGYGTAFVFGWLVHRSKGALAAIESRWIVHLVLGIAATAYLLQVMHAQPIAQPGLTKYAFACVFGVAVWGWSLGLTGAALRFLSNYSAVRRYIADASYWIYLAHLPVVAAFQVWVGHWPLHWGVKYPLVLAASFAVLFLSYHLLVRPTFIGKLLNGRQYPWRKPAPAPANTSPAAKAPVTSGNAPAAPIGEAVATLRGVTKRYGAITALAGIDLELRRGELLAVLGPNGAGKSTAISLWLGLAEADTGEVTLLGGSPQDVETRRHLGVMMQNVDLYKDLQVRELVALAASYYSDPMSVDEALALTGTTLIADRRYGKLSGGQKRQAQFAVAVVGRPRVLFLDEPTVGLDIKARETLWSSIRSLLKQGCSIVLTTHYLEEAEALANRVAMLANGRVVASGTVDEMRALVAQRRISCETTLAASEVARWEGVLEAHDERGRLSIVARDAEAVVRRLLATDPALRRLEVREAGLSEAFTELTREAA